MRPVLATPTARSRARATPGYGARSVVVVGAAVGTVAVGWVVAYLAYVAGVAWLLPPLILVAAASLVRGGQTLLDRLLLAAGALIGALCVGGLVFAVWPWGLHPVAVTGFAVTALAVVSVATGRVPRLPKPTLADGLSVANGIMVGVVVAWPVLALGRAERLALAAGADDLGRQLGLFDLVRRFGGYLYTAEVPSALLAYPQGASLLYGTLDGFVRSSASEYGTPQSALAHYLTWLAVGYAFLAVILTWGVQRLAAAGLTAWRRLVLVTVIAVAVLLTGLFRLAVTGYPGTVLGLALAALLVVLVCRPGGSSGETLLLASALVAATGFVFPPFLPAVLLIAGTWVVRQWARARRHPVALAALAVAAVTGAVVAVTGLTHAPGAPAIAGALPAGGRWAFLVLGAALLVGLLGRAPARSAVWRSFEWCVGAVVAGFILVLLAERLGGSAMNPTTEYYYFAEAAAQLLLAMAVLGLGTLLWLRPVARPPARRVARPWATAALAGAAVVMIGAAWGIVLGDTPAHRAALNRDSVVPWQFVHGQLGDTTAAALVEAGLAYPVHGAAAVVLGQDWRTAGRAQALLAALNRTPTTLAMSTYREPLTTYRWLSDPLAADDVAAVRRYTEIVAGLAGPVVLVCDSDRTQQWAEHIEERFGPRVVAAIVRPGAVSPA